MVRRGPKNKMREVTQIKQLTVNGLTVIAYGFLSRDEI